MEGIVPEEIFNNFKATPRICCFLFLLFLLPYPSTTNSIRNRRNEAKKKEFFGHVKNVQMNNELDGIRLFQHCLLILDWSKLNDFAGIDQAMSSLLAAIANKKLKVLPNQKIHSEFGKCSGLANSIPIHAKCVSNLLKGQFKVDIGKRDSSTNSKKYSIRFERYRKGGKNGKEGNGIKNANIFPNIHKKRNWIGSFRLLSTKRQRQKRPPNGRGQIHTKFQKIFGRRKRNIFIGENERIIVKQRDKYQLYNPSIDGRVSPIGSLAKILMAELLEKKSKNKQDIVPWQKTIERLKKASISIKKEKMNEKQKMAEENLGKFEENEFKFKGIERQKQQLPMEGQKGGINQQKPANRIVQLLRQAILLGYSIAGQNGTKIDERKTLKTLSPKFLNVIPNEAEETEENGTIDIFSPSLFSLYNEGKHQNALEKMTNLPSLFQHFGTNQDQQQWMNFIIEAAGIPEHADRIEKELANKGKRDHGQIGDGKLLMDSGQYERKMRRPDDGMPLYFTMENVTKSFGYSNAKKCAQLFEKLTLNLSREQHREMNLSGYALLSPSQLQMLYGLDSPYSNQTALSQFNSTNNLHAAVERDIHALAQMDHFGIRQKDIVLSPIQFSPFIGVNSNIFRIQNHRSIPSTTGIHRPESGHSVAYHFFAPNP